MSMNKCNKILVLAYSDINYDARILKQCLALVEHGYEVNFYGVRYSDVQYEQPFKVNYLADRAGNRLFQFIQYFILMLYFFMKTIGEARFTSVVMVHNMPNFLVLSTWYLKLRGCPVVLDIHDDSELVFSRKFQNTLFKKIFRFLENNVSLKSPTALMTVNKQLKGKLQCLTTGNIHVIHNSPEVDRFIDGPTYKVGSPIKLKFIGNLGEHYGVERLVEWVAALPSNLDVSLDIHGDGLLRATLEKKSREIDVFQRVLFHGRFNPSQLQSILSDGHIGIAPYDRNEMTDILLPVKLLEYTACGLASMCTKLKATSDYFPDTSLMYVNNYSDFESALQNIYSGKLSLEIFKRESKAVVDKISWQNEKLSFILFISSIGR
ncbi:glycosyltransferase [Aliidiomarina maris]|uniref:Glycosyltransferase involved in cell wall biosynthesis n=1 Tax=Aliidiomarina maris TaxID=531312 RepID=A0A327WPH0_9GAMM|nr:glycosyltransferase [Aliidiomarina maris]RAJ93625.1 glycosyltransferase involved in cell wall biosynthesis [Aliidiomarina maris]RUO19076.1 hypothetical protein CWE07_13280 [Aliidiomarina maris]